MKSFVLKNAEVVTGGSVVEMDIYVKDGKIFDLLSRGDKVKGKFEEIDCTRKVILPGLIDVHVHFREPGHAYKEDWETGSKAAVSGGVTTVFDMPNNNPPILTESDLEAKRELIKGRSYINYGLYIGFDGKNIEEINKVKNVPGVKFYACDSTGDMGVTGDSVEELFAKSNKFIVVHAEDASCLKEKTEQYLAEFEGRPADPSVHSKIRGPECALESVKTVCALAKKHNRTTHIAHVSTEAELDEIVKYKDFGVTLEVAPHHLLLCEDDYEHLGNLIKVNPPVRSRSDVFALWKGIKFGEVDIIATDHAPHTLEEKTQEYRKVPSGIPEVETTLPIMLNTVNDEGLSLIEVAELCSTRPAEIFGLKDKGKIEKGYDADLVVVDMEMEKKVENSKLFTKCGWSPYDGMTLKGWPIMTFVNGELKFENGKIVGKPDGNEVTFASNIY